jgi:hypothetical protein
MHTITVVTTDGEVVRGHLNDASLNGLCVDGQWFEWSELQGVTDID